MMTKIALVVLDTLRKDFFDRYFDWLPGVRFENVYATSHWTKPVHGSLFTGRYPSEIGLLKGLYFDCEEPSLPELLNDDGYTTRGVTTNSHVASPFGFDRGFDEFWDSLQFLEHDGVARYLETVRECYRSSVGTRKALTLAWAQKRTKDRGAKMALEYVRKTEFSSDEFFFLNLIEAHHPYRVPEEHQHHEPVDGYGDTIDFIDWTIAGDSTKSEYYLDLYQDCVEYLSDVYRDIFDELQSEFDYIITLSDHGELFGEYGVWMHWYGLYPELIHVPVTVWSGEERPSPNNPARVSSVLDVHRTIADLAGIDADSRGSNLLESEADGTYLAEYHGGTTPGLRERFERESEFPVEKLDRYDTYLSAITMADGYYGYETLNGFQNGNGEPAGQPQQLMDDVLATLEDTADEGPDQDVSPAVADRLEELGYR
jgi:arylsulfatase A-like enzyme